MAPVAALAIPDLEAESRTSPQAAGDRAFRLFCRPDISPYRADDHDALVARARVHLEKAQQTVVQAPGAAVRVYGYPTETTRRHRLKVLLVHGWTSEAAFMAAFVEPLRQRGHDIVALDLPAHGLTGGREANMVDCARALEAVVAVHGPFDLVIAHSAGALIALLVAEGRPPMTGAHPAGRYVLIAAPNRLRRMTDTFARTLRLSPQAHRAFERHVERAGHRSLAEFSTASLLSAVHRPALIIHDRTDPHVPMADAEEVASASPLARLVATEGWGHARLLYAPPVVRMVRDFADLVSDDVSGARPMQNRTGR